MRTTLTTLALAAALSPLAPAQPTDPIAPVPFTAVHIDDAFWTPRLDTNREVTVWYDFEQCEQTGRIRNFAVAGGLEPGQFEGIFYNDSDVYKVIEGAAYSLATQYDPKLDAYLDDLIATLAAAQEPDGYLYTQRTIQGDDIAANNAGKTRWSYLAHSHELYNVGHLYEAAVAHSQATGKRSLLDVAIKNADLLCRVFGPGEGQIVAVPGHEEIEIGLVKLAKTTGEQKYLDLAKFFIDMRGRADLRDIYGDYAQDHIPVAEQSEPVGHAVRAGYLYAGMADIAAALPASPTAPAYTAALDRIWERLVSRRMYLTGGIGAHRHTEGFGADYDLPNADAYNETCAAVASMLWNHRMFLLHGDSKYMDVFERTLYNAFLPGVSLSGDRFFYPNPLAADGVTAFNHGNVQRAPWFGTSCCPVNVVRVLPSLPGYVYATRGDDIFVNLYAGGQATVVTDSGSVVLAQQTEYPWDGRVRITVSPDAPRRFAIRLRVPGWSRGEPVPSDLYTYEGHAPTTREYTVNGEPLLAHADAGYAVFEREWAAGDVLSFNFPMQINTVRAHPAVKQDAGRIAIERGPLVYCFEGADNQADLDHLVIEPNAPAEFSFLPGLLGGIGVIDLVGREVTRHADGAIDDDPVEARAIPYYAWALREVGPMTVWVAASDDLIEAEPGPTIASQAAAGASHCWPQDTVGAINDRREPESSADHAIPRLTWWPHKGTTEWAQLDFGSAQQVSGVRVYFFDDTGQGACRLPESWRVLYREGREWTPVAARGEYAVELDGYSAIDFDAVTTDAVRVEVELRDGYSGGILELAVE